MKILCETRDGSNSLGEIDLRPTKAICVGRNYSAHAAELGHDVPREPLIFMKPVSSLCSAGAPILRPDGFERVDHEGELAIVIGKRACNVSEEDAMRHILGYTCANDITVRDLQKQGPWLRAKGMDSFLPIGPRIVTDLDPSSLNIAVRVNGETKQVGNTDQFIFSIAKILAFITAEITLEEHDLVLTGTPAGVGNLAPGDSVEVEIEGIGVLKNPVVARNA
ncbi:MAG: fumarylacetoacetate hydrolase family protein [Kofleriaceae bacterium]|nr:fumarylacetoacetate hydrolase family protein [Kofleriaceae bacterium]